MSTEATMSSIHDDEPVDNTGAEGGEGGKGGEEGGSGSAAPSPRAAANVDEPTAEEAAALENETEEEKIAREAAEAAGGDGETEEEKAVREAAEASQASGIDQFLSQYGITDGMIQFEAEEGGEPVSKHWNDLTPEEQGNILIDLANSGSPAIEEKYGLDPAETGLINFVRENGGDIDLILNNLANERLSQLQAMQDSNGVNYDEMTDDAVTMRSLRERDPEATEQDLTEELTRRKEGKFFKADADALRTGYKNEQASKAESVRQEAVRAQEVELEEHRGIIATSVSEIDNVIGWKVDDNQKNEILSQLLEVTEEGDSVFMKEVFSDPKKMFKAAWLYNNVESYVNELEKHYKKEMTNEYNRGKEFAINGLPPTPIHGSSSAQASGGEEKKTPPAAARTEEIKDRSTLWEGE